MLQDMNKNNVEYQLNPYLFLIMLVMFLLIQIFHFNYFLEQEFQE